MRRPPAPPIEDDDAAGVFVPMSPVTPQEDPDLVAAEGEGIRSRIPRGRGGDAKLGLELITEFSKLVREGQTFDNAARVCGLRRTTLARWLRKGQVDVEEEVDSLEASLAWALDSAIGDQETILVRGTMKGVKTDPRLALDVLARRRPADWAPAVAEREDVRKAYSRLSLAELKAEVTRLLGPGPKNAAEAEEEEK